MNIDATKLPGKLTTRLQRKRRWEEKNGIEIPRGLRGRERDIYAAVELARATGGPSSYVSSLDYAIRFKAIY